MMTTTYIQIGIGDFIIYGYCRVSTRWQLEGNSIEEQTEKILAMYTDAKIIIEFIVV